ncbi:MAG TPA: AraC family transcriptional regulator [Ramlibacter sp.]
MRPASSRPRPGTAAAVTPMAFARAIAAAYEQRGRSAGAALKQARITPARLAEADARMTAAQMELLSAAAMQELDDEGLGAFARRLPWGSYGMLARASLGAPDLGVALKRWCRHHGLLVDDLHLALTVTAGVATVAVEERRPLPVPLRELALAFVLRNVHGLACWYVDSRIPLQATRLPLPQPPHADAYAHMFPGPLQFGTARAELRFDAGYLALPLRRDEKALAQMLQRALAVTVLPYRRDRLLVPRVRHALAAHPESSHSAEALARLLNVSARTLHRQLRDEGASLQRLKDEVRLGRARELLLRTAHPVKQVAAAVGFRNEKSFSRAFRAWAGLSPARFREAPQGALAAQQ